MPENEIGMLRYWYRVKKWTDFGVIFRFGQCCGAATFLGGSGSRSLRSRSSKLGRLRLKAKKDGSVHKNFELLKCSLFMQIFYWIIIIFTFINCC